MPYAPARLNFSQTQAEPPLAMTLPANLQPPGLSTGSRLLLLGEKTEPRVTIVVRVKDGLIWISGTENPGAPGERVTAVHIVSGDAQYWAPTRVELVPPETLALRRIGPWQRRQRRAHVRLTTHGIDVELLRLEAGDETSEARWREGFALLDISAGGALVNAEAGMQAGECLRCRFHLPRAGNFDLLGRVVRVRPAPRSTRRHLLGIEFLEIGLEQQAALRRWIFAEEARRHREHKLRRERGER